MVAKKKKRRSYGIGFLLWVTFFIFSAIIVIVCQVSQVAIVRQMQQEETQKNIRNAASEVKDRRLGFDGLYLSDLARKYDITVKIINDSGYEVYPLFIFTYSVWKNRSVIKRTIYIFRTAWYFRPSSLPVSFGRRFT